MTKKADLSRVPDLLGDMEFLGEQLFSEGPFLLALVDPTLHYVRVSRSLATVLGWEAGYFPGQPILEHGFDVIQQALMRHALDMDETAVLKNWYVTSYGKNSKTPAFWHWKMVPLHDRQGKVCGLFLSSKDVTERRLLESEVIEAAMRERRGVSKKIHDHMGQLLAAISMKAKVLECKLDDQQLCGAEDARELQYLAAEVISAHREVAKQLYPLEVEAGGLLNAIGNLVEDTTQLYGIVCSVTVPDDEPKCVPVQAVHIYAIVKGIIQHAAKQAAAQKLTLVFESEPERYMLSITHDGKAYMRSRAIEGYHIMTFHAHTIGGQLTVDGHAGRAVTFTGSFPKMIEEN
ncbi:MAG: PAS domain-containing protein [Phycisphaeraceae bacterium]|nr:PAS domain-containing protein [Phycisphaeraceae bacterium]